MVDNKIQEANWKLINSLQETNEAVADSAVAIQQRNITFAQNVLEDGIKVLKSHTESTRALMHELTAQVQQQADGQEGFRAVVQSTIAAQERNTKFAQNVLENGVEALKSQVGVTRTLMRELESQAQKQQGAFQTLAHESLDAYMSFLRAPFSYYQQALNAAETTTRVGLENFQKATRAGLENVQNAARQARDTTVNATR